MKARTLIIILFAAVVLTGLYSHSSAALCYTRDGFKKGLLAKFNETLRGRGISNGIILELFSSPEGTFTIIVTRAGGCTAMLSSGVAWEDYAPEISGQGI